jgi:hypothetical protein
MLLYWTSCSLSNHENTQVWQFYCLDITPAQPRVSSLFFLPPCLDLLQWINTFWLYKSFVKVRSQCFILSLPCFNRINIDTLRHDTIWKSPLKKNNLQIEQHSMGWVISSWYLPTAHSFFFWQTKRIVGSKMSPWTAFFYMKWKCFFYTANAKRGRTKGKAGRCG